MLEMSHKQIFGLRVILFNYKIKIDNSNESNLIQNTCSFYSLLTMNSHGAVLLGFVYVLNMAVIKLKSKKCQNVTWELRLEREVVPWAIMVYKEMTLQLHYF